MAKLLPADIARVKAMGFLWNRESETFSARVVTGNGTLTAAKLRSLAACAEKYGNGTVALTSRMSFELPGIPLEHVEDVMTYAQKEGLLIGGTGAKVRPVTACKGSTCVYGNYDTQALAKELHERYFIGWSQVGLPHKFKIAVGGCPNSCIKPSLNDFGVEGRRPPRIELENCRGCGRCMVEEGCPMKAAKKQDGKIWIDRQLCSSCGVCSAKCPFGAIPREREPLYQIYVGGTWGKRTRMGTPLSRLVTREEIFPLLEKTMLWFKENGFKKERLGAAIDRIGAERFEQELFGDGLLARRQAICDAPVKERE